VTNKTKALSKIVVQNICVLSAKVDSRSSDPQRDEQNKSPRQKCHSKHMCFISQSGHSELRSGAWRTKRKPYAKLSFQTYMFYQQKWAPGAQIRNSTLILPSKRQAALPSLAPPAEPYPFGVASDITPPNFEIYIYIYIYIYNVTSIDLFSMRNWHSKYIHVEQPKWMSGAQIRSVANKTNAPRPNRHSKHMRFIHKNGQPKLISAAWGTKPNAWADFVFRTYVLYQPK
jgi:hypothetical protein